MSIGTSARIDRTKPKVAVVGGGAWGTTLALLALGATGRATLIVRDPKQADVMTKLRRHPRSLQGVVLPDGLEITAMAEGALDSADIAVFAVPVQSLRDAVMNVAPRLRGKTLVTAAKGLERATLRRPTEIVATAIQDISVTSVCALSGPNLAAEIAAGQPATTVVAGSDQPSCELVRDALMSPRFRIYTSRDVVGVEMGGALKNIIAIGAGIGDGLKAGDNAKAAFLTRGITEIARLGTACGAEPLTFAGLSGIGDLIATCASPLSRNNRVGRELARGHRLADILSGLDEVAEGVPTTEAAYLLGRRLGVELPITEQMYAVLFTGKSPIAAIQDLMGREPKQEQASAAR